LKNNINGMEADGVQVHSRRNDDTSGDPSSASPTAVALSTLTADAAASVPTPLGLFERWLSVWVALSMIAGTLVGIFLPSVPAALDRATVAHVNLPVSALVWLMIAPMTLQVDFASLKHAAMHPRALAVTLALNWAIQPFLMFGLAALFFRHVYATVIDKTTQDQVREQAATGCSGHLKCACCSSGGASEEALQLECARSLVAAFHCLSSRSFVCCCTVPLLFVLPLLISCQYIAGCVILGGSPCTAMVLVWSSLVGGHCGYTLLQVALNDLLLLVLYVPTLYLLLDLTGVTIPYVTIIASVALFVAVPFSAGAAVRWAVVHGSESREIGEARLHKLESAFHPLVMFGLLAVVVLTFVFQGQTVRRHWLHILLIALPLSLQTYLSFGLAYTLCFALGVEWRLAAPASFISSSNFFELAIAVALSSYGIDSGATLATTVGVLTEVPVMLSLVSAAKATKGVFMRRDQRKIKMQREKEKRVRGELQEARALASEP
jgi:ACR3 family arsenite transporter